jgi:hypothetical protein
MKVCFKFMIILILLSFMSLYAQTTLEDENRFNELLKEEVIGGVPEEKAEMTKEIFLEAKADIEELEFIGKEEIENLPFIYKQEDEIFKKFLYAPKLPGGIDHLAAGVGTRNSGQGHIRLRGLPPGALNVYAAVYFGTIYGPGQAIPAVVPIVFQGQIVYAYRIGLAAQPCWVPGGRFAAYRAFVTPLVSGNGDYYVGRLPSFLTDGRDPWLFYNNTPPLSEGASLVVLYSHKSVPYNSYVRIHHVNRMFYSSLTVFHYLPRPVVQNYALKHTRLGADGQAGFGLRHFNFATDERSFIFGTQIKGTGSPLNKDSDWNGYDGEPLNHLWDTHTMLIPYAIPNGATYYYVRYLSRGDCIVPVAHVLTARF